MLGTGLLVAQGGCLQDGHVEGASGLTGEAELVLLVVGDAFALEYEGFHIVLEVVQVYAQGGQYLAGQVVGMAQQSKKQMVGAYLVGAGAHRLFSGVSKNAAYFF